MKRNFEFDPFTVVRWGDRSIDLHNEYDLESFGTDPNGIQVALLFRRNGHASESVNLPPKVTLSCTGNVRVVFNDLGAIAVPMHSDGIEIAYFNADCDWQSFIDERVAHQAELQGLQVNFVSGFSARIFCDEVSLTAS